MTPIIFFRILVGSVCSILINNIRENTNAPIVWFGFEDYCYNHIFVHGAISILNGLMDRVNDKLKTTLDDDKSINLKHLIAEIGINYSYSNKGKYRWNAPYKVTK